jgi:predicted site-specific integrase-resolvase
LKSSEVLRLLKITRPTLTKYVKTGVIKVTEMPNGHYDYDKDSVYRLFNKNIDRKTCIYARVYDSKLKKDLKQQVDQMKQFSLARGYTVSEVYTDITNGADFENREGFFKMLDEVIAGNIERIVIAYKNRLTSVGFEVMKDILDEYNCELVIIDESNNPKYSYEEILLDIEEVMSSYGIATDTEFEKGMKKLFDSLINPLKGVK